MTRTKNPATAKLRKSPTTAGDRSDSVPFQLRLDAELHRDLKAAADTAGISLNQLIQGICRGALANLIQGEPDVSPYGFVSTKPQRGCVFFGRHGSTPAISMEDSEYYYDTHLKFPEGVDPGTLWFGLDFTNRGVVHYQRK
jgi:hypothetical protein